MPLPTRKQQIDAVAKFLDSDRNEGRSLEEIATEIVDGYLDMLLKGMKIPAPPLRRGQLIKHPADGKVRYIAWMEGDLVWLVTDSASYGWLGHSSAEAWSYCEEYRPKKRVEVDGKGKMVEMTDAEIAEAWDNPVWKVGDKLSQAQRVHTYEIIAVGPKCVLLQNVKSGSLHTDSNSNLDQYYRKESNLGSEW